LPELKSMTVGGGRVESVLHRLRYLDVLRGTSVCWAVLGASGLAACAGERGAVAPRPTLAQAAAALDRGGSSAVYTGAAFAELRRTAELRALLRSRARAEPVSIAAADEPGERMRVRARVVRANTGEPIPGALVYVYHTRDNGVYGARRMDGSELPKLFGYVLTDAQGRFEIESVLPGHYPLQRHPRHVHYEITPRGEPMHGREFLFADDRFLDARERKRAREHGWPIVTPTRDDRGVIQCELDLPVP
jgi:protocatechuate 3,4-dioxygenase beta subunit